MNNHALLPVCSIATVILLTFHLADDVVLGKDVLDIGRLSIYLPINAAWACGALLLARRRLGCVILILGALLGLVVVAIHASGPQGIHGTFWHVWLLVAIGSTSLFSLLLATISLAGQYRERRAAAN